MADITSGYLCGWGDVTYSNGITGGIQELVMDRSLTYSGGSMSGAGSHTLTPASQSIPFVSIANGMGKISGQVVAAGVGYYATVFVFAEHVPGLLVAGGTTDEQGQFSFFGLDTTKTFSVIAFDRKYGVYNVKGWSYVYPKRF
jgi:hypothetical protein